MSGTRQNYSLTADNGRITPPIVTDRGNWEFIAQYFQLFEAPTGVPALAEVVPADFDRSLYVFFFGHDRPLLGHCCSYYADATLTDTNSDTLTLPDPTYCEGVLPQSDPSLCDYIDANEASLSIGQVMTGQTVTNDVAVEGYPLLIDLNDRGLVDDGDSPLKCNVKGHILCSGDILHGQPYAQGMAGVQTHIPIVLAEPDYTQAMRDAGNRFTSSTVDYTIVGLWAGNSR